MLRKRDFVLFVLSVLFLLIGIGSTLSHSMPAPTVTTFAPQTNQASYSSEVISSTFDREARVQELRKKIASVGAELQAAPEVLVSEVEAAESEEDEVSGETMVCEVTVSFELTIPGKARFVEREGARLLVSERQVEVTATTGSTTEISAELVEDVVLQLPARRLPLSGTSCAGEGIIGVAQDGSPIRNTETNLYGVFGADTFIGYALDGFPIYGMNDSAVTDNCGGVVENGQYRYYLSSERNSIIGCYSGIPATL